MDWTDVHLAPLYPYLEALRLALVERMTIMGETPAAALTAELTPLQTPSAAFFSAFQDAISGELSSGAWINHVIGNFDNFTDFSYWNEADMLAAIGDAERVPAPGRLGVVSAAWVQQQYKILNMLRCFEGGLVGYANPARLSKFESTNNTSYDSAESAIAALRALIKSRGWYEQQEPFAWTSLYKDAWTGKYVAALAMCKWGMVFRNPCSTNIDLLIFCMGGEGPVCDPPAQYGNHGGVVPYLNAFHLYKTVPMSTGAELTEYFTPPDEDNLQFILTPEGAPLVVLGCGIQDIRSIVRPTFNFRTW